VDGIIAHAPRGADTFLETKIPSNSSEKIV